MQLEQKVSVCFKQRSTFDIKQVSDRIVVSKLITGKMIFAILSIYTPYVSLNGSIKDAFCDD